MDAKMLKHDRDKSIWSRNKGRKCKKEIMRMRKNIDIQVKVKCKLNTLKNVLWKWAERKIIIIWGHSVSIHG